jgi:cGMP-dependent protein kinase
LLSADVSAMRVGDLESLATLGVGGFGRVELVQCRRRPSLVFALKRLKKQHVVETQQQEHVLSEKTVMLKCHSSFICRLEINIYYFLIIGNVIFIFH